MVRQRIIPEEKKFDKNVVGILGLVLFPHNLYAKKTLCQIPYVYVGK